MRREVDTKGKGLADTVYYYENEKMVREERDDNGTGGVSFRTLHQNGRRAKIEEDTSGRGKIDRWIYFDSNRDGEIVLKEERTSMATEWLICGPIMKMVGSSDAM